METKTGIKNAFTVQALNAFIGGVTYILLPLLMLERKISIESMGLIFAILPLVSQTSRVIFATISDYIGRKKFYWLCGIMNLVHLIVYYFSKSPFGFLLGKISEGVRDASLWSVNRAYFLDHSQEREKTLVKMRGMGSIFSAIGTLLAGFLLTKLFYDKTLCLLMGLSFLIFPNVKKLIDKEKRKISISAILETLSFSNKTKKFKTFFILFFVSGLYFGLVGNYVFPLFLKEAGIVTQNIGLILGMRVLLGGICIYALRSIGKGKYKILIGGLFCSLFLILLPFTNQVSLPILMILLGIAGGISDAGHETIFIQVINHNSMAGDIGILMIGTHVGVAITQAIAGFAITSFGFLALFFSASALNLFFCLAAFKNMS